MSPRSPLRRKPLRYAGQSLDEALARLWIDRGVGYFMFAAGFVIIAIMEWLGYLLHSPRRPMLFSVLAVAAIAIMLLQVLRLRKEAKSIRLGRDGERLVGQFLEELRADGASSSTTYRATASNLDHVVISDRGIFVVETKTYSKPVPDAKVTFESNQLLVAGRKPDRDPIKQVRAQTRWLLHLLRESTGRQLPIRGAIVFPNWWVDPNPGSIPQGPMGTGAESAAEVHPTRTHQARRFGCEAGDVSS